MISYLRHMGVWRVLFAVGCAAGALGASAVETPATRTLKAGDAVMAGGQKLTLQVLDNFPVIDNEWSRKFRYDTFENPKLAELRQRYRLSDAIAPACDEFEAQLKLLDWTHNRFTKFGKPSTNCHGAMAILEAVDRGHTFFCAQYTEVFVSAAASLGWVDRPLALRRHRGVNQVGGSTEHSVTEIWSNQHRKWVMLDPTSNMYLEKSGTPLNAYEIRREWFEAEGTNLVFVTGGKRSRKADLPILLKDFPGFGSLAVHRDELDKYGFIGWIPNTDLMNSGYDYGKMFIYRDALCDGTSWHIRPKPENPAVDPYFPIGQAAVNLCIAEDGRIDVSLRTLTPNFKTYEVRLDGDDWRPSADTFAWNLHAGTNRLEARTVNLFGVVGPASRLQFQ